MTHADAARWNDRYTQDGARWRTRSPRQLLLDFAYLLPPTGLALDAAAGVALHGLFLAERGLRVIALDVSEVGLRLARQLAQERGVWLETAVLDLSHPWLPTNTFDVIVNFRFLERATFPVYRQALKQGGLLFFETFLKTQANADAPAHYLNPGELRDAFHDFEILHSAIADNPHYPSNKQRVAEQLIARKPEAIHERE
jgi:2-polyprenyl-3-methyl-5-hydroxy-6-metoxy-1,4-benzoquinol methylase